MPALRIATLLEPEADLRWRLEAARFVASPLIAGATDPVEGVDIDAVDIRGKSRAEARQAVLDATDGWVLWMEPRERLHRESADMLCRWLGKTAEEGGPGDAMAAYVHVVGEDGVARPSLRLTRGGAAVRFEGGDAEAPEASPLHKDPVVSLYRAREASAGDDGGVPSLDQPLEPPSAAWLERLRDLAAEGEGETRIAAIVALIRHLIQSDRLDEALKLGHEALRLDPRFAEIHGALADIYRIRGEWERARVFYKSALALGGPPSWVRRPDFAKYGWEAREGIERCNLQLPLDRRDRPRFRRPRPLAPSRVSAISALRGGQDRGLLECFLRQSAEDAEWIAVDSGGAPSGRLQSHADPRVRYVYAGPVALPLGQTLDLAREHAQGACLAIWEPGIEYAPSALTDAQERAERWGLSYWAGFRVESQDTGQRGFLRPGKKYEDRPYFGLGLCFRHEIFHRIAFRPQESDAALFFIEDAESRGFSARGVLDTVGHAVVPLAPGDLAAEFADFEPAAGP